MTKDYELVADVASYQPDTLSFFKALAAQNVRAVIVKLTEGSANGSAYVNPKAAAQLAHARAAGLLVHAYHYAKFKGSQDASAEAAWFVQHAQALKVTPASVMVLDIEDQQNANWLLLTPIRFCRQLRQPDIHMSIFIQWQAGFGVGVWTPQ
nr:GH25 family lysozyme [Liquorilactobacillus satsumensis]